MTRLDIHICEPVLSHGKLRRLKYYRWTERDDAGRITRASEWTTAPPKQAPWRTP